MRLLLAFAALLVAAPASAHVRLERSTPAAGAIVHAPLAEIRIVFSAAVEVRYTSIVLYAPSGGVVALDSLQADSASKGRAFFVSAPRLPEAGTYRLEWRTAGADGHVLTGSFTFIADTAAVEAAPDSTEPVDSATTPAASDPAAHEHHPAARPAGVFASQSPLHVLVRALQFAALLALIGAFVLRRLLRRGVLPATQQPAFDRRLRRYTAVVLSAFLLLLPVRLWLQSGALHGASGALDPYLLGSLLTGLDWGHAWLAQLVLAGIAALTFATPLLPLAELAALALAFTPPLLGHAAGMETGRNLVIAVHGVHVLGAALWLGTLTALFLVAFPALRRAAASDEALAAAASVHRFSPLALAAAATTVAAGLVLGWLHVGSLAHFTGTTYGRTLALKLAILAVVVLAGFLNWRRAGLRSASSPDLRGLRRRIALELLGATAVLLVTGVLVALPPP